MHLGPPARALSHGICALSSSKGTVWQIGGLRRAQPAYLPLPVRLCNPSYQIYAPEPFDRLSTAPAEGHRSRVHEAPTCSARMFHNHACSQTRRCVRLALSNPRGANPTGPIQGLVRCGVKLISIRNRARKKALDGKIGRAHIPRLVCRQGPPDFESGLAT
jgi:hypothetical protein